MFAEGLKKLGPQNISYKVLSEMQDPPCTERLTLKMTIREIQEHILLCLEFLVDVTKLVRFVLAVIHLIFLL